MLLYTTFSKEIEFNRAVQKKVTFIITSYYPEILHGVNFFWVFMFEVHFEEINAIYYAILLIINFN